MLTPELEAKSARRRRWSFPPHRTWPRLSQLSLAWSPAAHRPPDLRQVVPPAHLSQGGEGRGVQRHTWIPSPTRSSPPGPDDPRPGGGRRPQEVARLSASLDRSW